MGSSKEITRVILLSGHNFIEKGCHVKIDEEIITEWDLTNWLVGEIFKKERLLNIDLITKSRNEYKKLINEVNSLNGDILISCHFNAANGKAQGTEVLYAANSTKGKKLAEVAQNILVKNLKLNDRGIKPTASDKRGGSILNRTKPIAILLEPFFLDSVKTHKELSELMEKTADSIIELLEYLEKNEV